MEARIAVAKVPKYAVSESGDTLEMVERPAGGLSFVLADGQRSGKPAKAISNVVARKAISLLAEGVRDGAAARAAADYLYTYRRGKVLATLNILSIDLASQTMVITRNNPAPVLLIRQGEVQVLDERCEPVGARWGIRPAIREIPLNLGLIAVVYTDGLTSAGERQGSPMDVVAEVNNLLLTGTAPVPEDWSQALLARALELESGRPRDDISVLVAAIVEGMGDRTRRLSVRVPL